MDFYKRIEPASEDLTFREEGYYVWCGNLFQFGGVCYMVYARWKKEHGFDAWLTHSEVCLAKADHMLGTFRHVKVLFPEIDPRTGSRIVTHNPVTIIHNGRLYLYFMVTYGKEYMEYRNNQRIGAAYADDPEGEWTRLPEPVIDVSEGGIDSLLVSNPTALVREDNTILMLYKAVAPEEGTMGRVICAAAEADSPLGPFKKQGKPLMNNPESSWCVEDPCIWREDGKYYAIAKDFHGYFTKTQQTSIALFSSKDGLDWEPDPEHPLAMENKLIFRDKEVPVPRLERPQVFCENGHPTTLLCACFPADSDDTFNIRFPLK